MTENGDNGKSKGGRTMPVWMSDELRDQLVALHPEWGDRAFSPSVKLAVEEYILNHSKLAKERRLRELELLIPELEQERDQLRGELHHEVERQQTMTTVRMSDEYKQAIAETARTHAAVMVHDRIAVESYVTSAKGGVFGKRYLERLLRYGVDEDTLVADIAALIPDAVERKRQDRL